MNSDQSRLTSDRRRFFFGSILLVIALLIAYWPAIHGGPVWDDDYMLTENSVMRQPHALWRIWTDLSAVQVYYPLTLSLLWIESRFFGTTNLTGFHVINVLLHAANAIVLWRLLRRLEVRGAFAIAALWALHPVCVESVAWITETKNTLSGLFYAWSLWAFLEYLCVFKGEGSVHRGRWYCGALLLFVLAMAAKTTAVTMPAAALLILWWKTGRIRAGHVYAVIPFLLLAGGCGSLTQYVELHITAQWRPDLALSLSQRLLVAGRAICFYTGKLFWPTKLSFLYPRWVIDESSAGQWSFPILVLVVLLAIWCGRKHGRGPLAGALFFCGTLVPALGFFFVYFQRYSFVSDHFQYLAGIGLIAVVVASIASTRVSPVLLRATFGIAAATLMFLTWRSAHRFQSDAAVWYAALEVDPGSPLANLNVAAHLITLHQHDAAIPLLKRAAESKPMIGMVCLNLGRIASERKDYESAVRFYFQAAELEPQDTRCSFLFGTALLITGRFEQAVNQLRLSLRSDPDNAYAHDNLGVALLKLGRKKDAIVEFNIARHLNPNLPLIHKHLNDAGEK